MPLLSTLGGGSARGFGGIGAAFGAGGGGLYGNGDAGDFTGSGVINVSQRISSTASSGSTTLTMSSTTGFSDGDPIFIHQTQDTTVSNAGVYEINYIKSVNSSTQITLSDPTTNTYNAGSTNTTNQNSTVAQVVSCANYNTFTPSGLVLAPRWDGTTGGILFIVSKTSFDGNGHYISAWGKGWRGGFRSGGTGTQTIGYAGESYRGHLNNHTSRNDTGGGGASGGQNAGGDSGAGGGHAAAGGAGTDAANPNPQGGNSVGSQAMTKIFFGGGGGTGGDNDDRVYDTYCDPDTGTETSADAAAWTAAFGSYTDQTVSWGSNRGIPVHGDGTDISSGGGIVVLFCPSITNLRATVRGTPGIGGTASGEKSGHGATGSIFITTKNNSMSINDCTVDEQTGGTIDGDSIGQGSGGRCRFDIEGGTTYTGTVTTGSQGTLQVNNI